MLAQTAELQYYVGQRLVRHALQLVLGPLRVQLTAEEDGDDFPLDERHSGSRVRIGRCSWPTDEIDDIQNLSTQFAINLTRFHRAVLTPDTQKSVARYVVLKKHCN